MAQRRISFFQYMRHTQGFMSTYILNATLLKGPVTKQQRNPTQFANNITQTMRNPKQSLVSRDTITKKCPETIPDGISQILTKIKIIKMSCEKFIATRNVYNLPRTDKCKPSTQIIQSVTNAFVKSLKRSVRRVADSQDRILLKHLSSVCTNPGLNTLCL